MDPSIYYDDTPIITNQVNSFEKKNEKYCVANISCRWNFPSNQFGEISFNSLYGES